MVIPATIPLLLLVAAGTLTSGVPDPNAPPNRKVRGSLFITTPPPKRWRGHGYSLAKGWVSLVVGPIRIGARLVVNPHESTVGMPVADGILELDGHNHPEIVLASPLGIGTARARGNGWKGEIAIVIRLLANGWKIRERRQYKAGNVRQGRKNRRHR